MKKPSFDRITCARRWVEPRAPQVRQVHCGPVEANRSLVQHDHPVGNLANIFDDVATHQNCSVKTTQEVDHQAALLWIQTGAGLIE